MEYTRQYKEFLIRFVKDKYAFGASLGQIKNGVLDMGKAPNGVFNKEFANKLLESSLTWQSEADAELRSRAAKFEEELKGEVKVEEVNF